VSCELIKAHIFHWPIQNSNKVFSPRDPSLKYTYFPLKYTLRVHRSYTARSTQKLYCSIRLSRCIQVLYSELSNSCSSSYDLQYVTAKTYPWPW